MNILSIFAAPTRMYAGATNEFGYYSHDKTSNRLKFHSLAAGLPKRELNFGEIWAIHDMNGAIVFQGKNNFFIYSKDGRTTNLRQNVRIESSAVIGGRLVFASKEGIHEVIGRRTVTLLEQNSCADAPSGPSCRTASRCFWPRQMTVSSHTTE